MFLIVYGGCNWITAHRSDVGTFYLQWEREIPFVPLFILPYMSIDLFFVVAPFLCRTDANCRSYLGVIAAIIVAGICFLLFPLRFAFPRPHAGGWLGALFDWFRGMDAPYNLLPSLHAAFTLILLDLLFSSTRAVSFAWLTMTLVRSDRDICQSSRINITSSTSSVVLSWPDIVSTFFASLRTRRQLSRIAASVRITQRERRLS